MPTVQLPAAINTFFVASTSQDRDAFAAIFADGASVDDRGVLYTGAEAIADWNETDNMGVGIRYETTGYVVDGDDHVVSMRVTKQESAGDGTARFRLVDDAIESVVISG